MVSSTCHTTQSTELRTLVDLLQQRRTRRFGCGMELPAGPLQYRSEVPPAPLTAEELHYLLFAGVGETGPHLADMQYARRPGYEDGQGMAIMGFRGRTVPSACAANTTRLFVSNDDGVFYVAAVPHPNSGARPNLVRLQSGRLEIPRQLPFMLSFNQWYANRPGTEFIMPVTEVARVYMNLLLVLLSEEYGYFIVDTDNGNAGCGLDEFRKSRGGHLHDDPGARRTMTLRDLDAAISDTALQEQGAVCQNMFLMEQAIGLGGGVQSVGSGRHLLGWEPQIYPGLGFLFAPSLVPGARSNPVGIPDIWESLCPPFTPSMENAVRSIVYSKFGASGIYPNPAIWPWIPRKQEQEVQPHSARSVEAVIRFCEYVYRMYGRFPAHVDAFKTVIAFQAHHVDVGFYDKFYSQDALGDIHREHMAVWHGAEQK